MCAHFYTQMHTLLHTLLHIDTHELTSHVDKMTELVNTLHLLVKLSQSNK